MSIPCARAGDGGRSREKEKARKRLAIHTYDCGIMFQLYTLSFRGVLSTYLELSIDASWRVLGSRDESVVLLFPKLQQSCLK